MTFKCKRCGQCCGAVWFSKKEYKKIRRRAKRLNISFKKVEAEEGKIIYFVKKIYNRMVKLAECDLDKIKKDDMRAYAIANKLNDLVCPFLKFDEDKKATCIIYDDRPQICKDFGKGGHKFLTCPNNK